MRVTMTLNDELLERVDSFAKLNYMNRSSVVSFACNQFLLQNELISLILNMSKVYEKIAETGNLDDESKAKLDDFYKLVDVITQANDGAMKA